MLFLKRNLFFLIFIVVVSVVYLFTGFLDLDKDVINPDGINWHTRSYNFTESLLNGDFQETFQAYHPGVTLMWLTGPALYRLAEILASKGFEIYSRDTFVQYDYLAKSLVIGASFVFFIISIFLLKKIVSQKNLVAFSLLLILEPFVLGVRRLYHLDYLSAYLTFISFLSLYIFCFKDKKIRYLLLSSLMFVLAFLTKTSTLIFVPMIPIMLFFTSSELKNKLVTFAVYLLSTIVFLFLFFPALWGNPRVTIPFIYEKVVSGIIDIGIFNRAEIGSSGKNENILTKESKENKFWYFYLLEFPYVLSPVTVILLFLSVFYFFTRLYKKQFNKLNIFSLITFALFLAVMSYAGKKGLRYGIVFIPFLFLIISDYLANLEKNIYKAALLVIFISLVVQLYLIHPYYYVYGDPLFGGVKARTKIFEPSSFGVAAYETGNMVNAKISQLNLQKQIKLAASKSFKYTVPKAKVASWPSCDVDFAIVYGLDKKPEELCQNKFELMDKTHIGNYDYWLIYIKKDINYYSK